MPGFVAELGLPGLIDIHTHFLPQGLQEAVWRYFDELDGPAWDIVYRHDEATRLRTLAALGVVAHTALAYAHQPGLAAALNRHTLALAEDHDAVIPTFTFHPEPGAADEVADALARGGRVAKVHLQVGRFHADDDRLDEVWPQLEAARVPVVLHAGEVYGAPEAAAYCGVGGVERLLSAHPDLVLVIAHLGGPDFADFLRLAERAPGVRMDTAMVLTDPSYLGEYPVHLMDRLQAIHRQLVFGSDFPSIPHAYAAQVRGMRQLELGADGLRWLLHDHAAQLLTGVRTP